MTDQTPEPTPAVERAEAALEEIWADEPDPRPMAITALTAALDVEEMTQMIVEAEYAWASRSALHGVDPTKHPSLPSFVAAVQVAAILGATS